MNKIEILKLIQDGYATEEALVKQVDISRFELNSVIDDLFDEELIEEKEIYIPILGAGSPQYKTIFILTEEGEEVLENS